MYLRDCKKNYKGKREETNKSKVGHYIVSINRQCHVATFNTLRMFAATLNNNIVINITIILHFAECNIISIAPGKIIFNGAINAEAIQFF